MKKILNKYRAKEEKKIQFIVHSTGPEGEEVMDEELAAPVVENMRLVNWIDIEGVFLTALGPSYIAGSWDFSAPSIWIGIDKKFDASSFSPPLGIKCHINAFPGEPRLIEKD